MKKKKIIILLLIVIVVIIGYILLTKFGREEITYQIGKTPGSYECTFGDNFFLCKEDVWEGNEPKFNGLYIKNLDENDLKATLLSDDYYSCANVYHDSVIYINNNSQIIKIDLKGKKKEVLIDNKGKHIADALVIGDILYYFSDTESNVNSLCAMDLKTKKEKQIVNNVNVRYLYHYCGKAGIISKKDGKLLICGMEDGIVEEYDRPEREIMGFLDDGTVICYEDGTVYAKADINDKESSKLFQKNNIYRIIVHPKEMLVCTFDRYGLIEVFIYDFAKGELDKIVNANTVPKDFNEQYIVCHSEEEGVGDVELVDRKNGEIYKIFTDEEN